MKFLHLITPKQYK